MPGDPREIWGDLAPSAFVGANVLFKTLDDAARADLLALARCQAFEAGEAVVRQGEPGDDFFLVFEGQASVTLDVDGRAVDLGVLERGACFGEFTVLGERARVATVAARTALTVVRFPAPVVAALAERFPRLHKLLEALRDARLRDAQAKRSA